MISVAEKLEGVKRSGATITARCPAHDDRRNSLSVTEKDDKIFCTAMSDAQ